MPSHHICDQYVNNINIPNTNTRQANCNTGKITSVSAVMHKLHLLMHHTMQGMGNVCYKKKNLKNIMAPIICIIGYTYYESTMTRTSSQYWLKFTNTFHQVLWFCTTCHQGLVQYQQWHLSYTGWKPNKNAKQNPISNCNALSYSKWPNQYHLKSLTILSIFIFTIFLFFHKFIFILIIIYTLSFIVFTLTFLL